jgi:hypothetical protein
MKQEPKTIMVADVDKYHKLELDRYMTRASGQPQYQWSLDATSIDDYSSDVLVSVELTPALIRSLIAGLQEVLADIET